MKGHMFFILFLLDLLHIMNDRVHIRLNKKFNARATISITGRSLPYMTNTGPTVSLFSCCLTQPHETPNNQTRVVVFRLLYRLYMKYTFT